MANTNGFLASKFQSLKLKVKSSLTDASRKNKWDGDTAYSVNDSDSSGEAVIQVDPLTDQPSAAWERLSRFHASHQLPIDSYVVKPGNKETSLRFVCLSDTHGVAEQERRQYQQRVPDGDVLIHCGDFTMHGRPSEISSFDDFMGKLPHPIKLVIAGNHEPTLEEGCYLNNEVLVRWELGLPGSASSQQLMTACKTLINHSLYLQDESITICGINIYASPWVPVYGSWAFSRARGRQLLKKWNNIPSSTDILITHGPPLGYGDEVKGAERVGCTELLNTVVTRVRPKFHVFGHIHSGYGMWTNGTTTFINSAICSNEYKAERDPIVFDYPLPSGYTRADFLRLSTQSLHQVRDTAAAAAKMAEDETESENDASQAMNISSAAKMSQE